MLINNIPKVIVIGDCFIDHWWLGTRRGPSAEQTGVDVVDIVKEIRCHGGAENVAENLKYLGAQVVKILPGGYKPVKNRLMMDGVQVARWDENDYCESIGEGRLQEGVELCTANPSVVVSDYNKGSVGEALRGDLQKLKSNVGIYIDTKKDPSWFGLDDRAVFFPNLKEYEQYKEQYDSIQHVFVTLGERGIQKLVYGNSVDYCPQKYIKQEVKSVCGAGDIVVAAMVYSQAVDTGYTPIEFTMAAAAVGVEKICTPVVNIQEVYERLTVC